ncbi:presenilin family intramembrane aspartyl protease PSH [Halostagnicola kamekurae]|uniref:Signal-peptide peptidase, presenilin aspartyl protease n=1 Tax=Halostagnicola kamekurae TaxID=619731 RepID=A0A1I6QXQ7_9EURY|nr:presenilin family intramembrane aspartyl protease PSH [Halostagnicola kamekurae]SFS57192.1 Signal-peptide peptidase, presenilin aspartyl protease [Halostagnicola kamekurae]
MNQRARMVLAVGMTVLLFLTVQFGALALVEPFYDADRQAVDDPTDPTNSAIYFAVILVATGIMLAAFKYDAERLIRGLIIAVSGMLAYYVFTEVIPPAVSVGSVNALALVAAVGVAGALLVYPEWYVIDVAGVVMAAGAGGLFGISFGLLPAILFLAVLAIYDAISVYKTEHMLDLADGVMDLNIPVIFIIPTSLPYSYLAEGSTDGVLEDDSSTTDGSGHGSSATNDSSTGDDTPTVTDGSSADSSHTGADTSSGGASSDDGQGSGRDALFIGLGDAVIPTILVASAAFFLEGGAIDVPGVALNVPALGAILGTTAGLLVLMYMVTKGRAHAGLPLLNGGAIGGYLVGVIASGIQISTALGL